MRKKILFEVLFFILVVGAKHGEGESEDDADPSSTTPLSPSSLTPSTSLTSTIPPTGTTTSAIGSVMSQSSLPTPLPSSAVQFTPPSNFTACTRTAFTWHSSFNSDLPITVAVTNERQIAPELPLATTLVSRTLTTDVAMSAGIVAWEDVDVPQGWYSAIAFDTAGTMGLFSKSPIFFVQVGNDASCLTTTSSASSNITASPSPTQSDAAAFTSSSSTPDGNPSIDISDGIGSLSTGGIIGSVIGAVVGFGGLIAAFTFYRLHYFKRARPPPQRPGGPYYLF